MEYCEKDGIDEIQINVQINNEIAICFYSDCGFKKIDLLKHYYKRVSPPHAYLLSKRLDGKEIEEYKESEEELKNILNDNIKSTPTKKRKVASHQEEKKTETPKKKVQSNLNSFFKIKKKEN